MEKSFRQIESEIADNGFQQCIKDAASDLQNVTRLLGYVVEAVPELEGVVDSITGQIIRAGLRLDELSEMDCIKNREC